MDPNEENIFKVEENGPVRQRTFHIPDSISKRNRLRYHLATEGCPESQTSLAKTLLQEATDSKFEKNENAELAVNWLLRAANEGHEEALELLESCYKSGIGISDQNQYQVESCLNSSENEKTAQRIGQTLYRLLAYDTKEPVSLVYFQKKLDLFLRDESGNAVDEAIFPNCCFAEPIYISVFDVVGSINQCLEGSNPSITICDTNVCTTPKKDKSYINLALYCIYSLQQFCQRCQANLYDLSIVFAIFFTGLLMFCTTLLIWPSAMIHDSELLMDILKNWLCLLSFAIMLVTSANLLNHRHGYQNMEKWAQVVRKFEPNANTKHYYFKSSDLWQTLFLFVGTVACMIFSENQFEWLFQSHLHLPSIIFLCATLATTKLSLFKISFTIHSFLATLKYSLLLLPFVNIPMLEFQFSESNVICISPLISLLVLAVILHIYLAATFTAEWHFFHVPSIIWLSIIIASIFSTISLTALLMDLLFWVGVFIVSFKFEPITSFNIVLATSALFISGGNSYGCWLILFAILLTVFFKSISKKLITVLGLWKLVLTSVIASIVLYYIIFSTETAMLGESQNLSWSDYSKVCHKMAWLETNMAQVQIDCQDLEDASISIVGTVHSVRRTDKRNRIESMIKLFPKPMADWLTCKVGHEQFRRGEKCCTLDRWSNNQFEIVVHIKGTFRVEAEVVFQTDDKCIDFVLNLHEGDGVTMVGKLTNGVGTNKPILILENGSCLTCDEPCICHVYNENDNILRNVSMSHLSRFFLEPFVYLKHI